MKNTIFTYVLICICQIANAQDHEINFSEGTIEILDFSNITVEGYDGNKVLIYEYFQENFNPDQEAGLQKINSRAPVLEKVLEHKIKGQRLILTESYSMGSFLIKVPKNLNVVCKGEKLHPYGNRNFKYIIRNIAGEIEIMARDMVNVELENNTKGVSCVTHGNIVATFGILTEGEAIWLDTYRGYVDVTVPKDAAMNFNLSAKKGDIFTDLNILKKGSDKNPEHFFGTLNGGGFEFMANTQIGGNIYLRGM